VSPFAEILATRRNFTSLLMRHNEFSYSLASVAPLYDPRRSPGPPFDIYYHLELIDRLHRNVTRLLREMESEWNDLYASD
jgi:hypothetical protein